MSTENRNKVLLGFGALVAVVIVAIALWPANFRKEDASGAIGAVQKHHAPQITQKDVILGDENVRHQQKVLYADFLDDAAKLRAMAGSRNEAGVTAQLNALANGLRQRYASEAAAAITEVELAVRQSAQRAEAESHIAAARSILAQKEMSERDMEQLRGKLGLLVVIASKGEANARIASADREIAEVANSLAAAKLDDEYMAAAKKLADAETLLARPLYAISLADDAKYLDAIQREMKVASDAEQTFAVRLGDEQAANRIVVAAEELEAKAAANIKASAEQMNEMAARLDSMDAQMAQVRTALGTRAGLASRGYQELSSKVNAVRTELGQREEEFFAQSKAAASDELVAAKRLDNGDLATRIANLQLRLQARQQP
jgi:hypothetical protein